MQMCGGTYVLLPITLLMFIWTLSCLRLMANTTSVSHGEPCCAAAFPFRNDGVEVLVTESVKINCYMTLQYKNVRCVSKFRALR